MQKAVDQVDFLLREYFETNDHTWSVDDNNSVIALKLDMQKAFDQLDFFLREYFETN